MYRVEEAKRMVRELEEKVERNALNKAIFKILNNLHFVNHCESNFKKFAKLTALNVIYNNYALALEDAIATLLIDTILNLEKEDKKRFIEWLRELQ